MVRANRAERPRSAVSAGVGWAGLTGLLGWAAIAHVYRMDGPYAAAVAVLACGVPMVGWSLLVDRVHRSPSTGLDWSGPLRPAAATREISLTKLCALWVTWAGIAAIYALGRWYWAPPYLGAMHVMAALVAPLLVLSVPYIFWIDRRMIEPRDGCYQFGLLVTGRGHLADGAAIGGYLRVWAVKGFWTAFMVSIVPDNWAAAVDSDASEMLAHPLAMAQGLIALLYVIDVCMAMVGYLLTMRPLDSHIRSANPYLDAWVVALMCYPPFQMVADGPLDYDVGGRGWDGWLAGHPIGLALMAVPIVGATAVYAWATVAFGLRFSNLTDRGILTHGPYRFTKHPAYLAKNLSWWLMTLPFLPGTLSPVDAIRNTVLLACVSGVYFWRAKTEERHLSADPAYRDYAAWIAVNGALPRLFAWVRGLRRRRRRSITVPAE